ncbi:DUF1036 domain-containing protein [Parvibaculum sp.]|jgi:uncharacterized membrane protein|uniref:DUF1036 domain-containing protein n=1 Tax=Parvibaculum sp. TaxID=2024848 RepID=UPI00391A30EC
MGQGLSSSAEPADLPRSRTLRDFRPLALTGEWPQSMKNSFHIAAAALFLCLFFPAAAHADYKFCNRTSYVLDAAVGYSAGEIWKSRGWTRLMPGSCETVLEGPVGGGDYYVFARSFDAHKGSIKYFSGNSAFCIVDAPFEIEGRDQCAMRGFDSADFLKVETKAGAEWTTSFSEASEYNVEESRVAGAQRLLMDLGFAMKQVDGIAARNTLRAVQAFQRSANLAPTGSIDESLLNELASRAIAAHRSVGLDFCNRTSELVWAAVGFESGGEDISSGWIRIDPGSCRKAVKGRLAKDAYYFYAEAVGDTGAIVTHNGQPLVWGGDRPYCTKPTRFEIRGRERCALRGYDEKAFRRIETSGKPFIEVPLDQD